LTLVPGETLKFKARKRGGSNLFPGPASLNSNSLNASFNEGANRINKLVPSNSSKRSITPMRKEFHIRGRQSTNNNANKSVLIPINHGRFASNQVKSFLREMFFIENRKKENHQ